MKMKDLVNKISNENNIPAAIVRKVVRATLSEFSELIEQEESFFSPQIKLRTKNKAERKVVDKETGEEKLIASRKVGIISIGKRKKSDPGKLETHL